MTIFLDREARTQPPAVLGGNIPLDDSIEKLPSPEVNDGSVIEQRLNLAIDVLVAEAKEAGIPCHDDIYFKNIDDGKCITFSRETDDKNGDEVIIRTLGVRDLDSSVCFRYRDTMSPESAEFSVRRENIGAPMSAEFSGTEGQPLSGDDVALSQHLVETMLDVVAKDKEIDTGTLETIVRDIKTLETAASRRPLRSRVLSWFTLNRAAA